MCAHYYQDIDHAKLYTQIREPPPDILIGNIMNFLEEKITQNNWNIAVDVGCGGGQGTNKLSKYFGKCYGFDISQAQINEAKESKHCDNVYFDVCLAEKIPQIQANSVQLLTAFSAVHWFDLQEFLRESDRILVTNGVMAFVCCHVIGFSNVNNSTNDQSLTQVLEDFRNDMKKIVDNKLLLNRYKDILLPDNYQYLYKDNIVVDLPTSVEQILGGCRECPGYSQLVLNDKSLAEKYLQDLIENLKTILQTNDLSNKDIVLKKKYSYDIVFGRKLN